MNVCQWLEVDVLSGYDESNDRIGADGEVVPTSGRNDPRVA